MTVVDHFSKVADVRTLRSKEAGEVCQALNKALSTNGIPKIIISDNGKEFANSHMKELTAVNIIEWRHGAPYSPTTTGLVERFNRTFMEKLRKVKNLKKLKLRAY